MQDYYITALDKLYCRLIPHWIIFCTGFFKYIKNIKMKKKTFEDLITIVLGIIKKGN